MNVLPLLDLKKANLPMQSAIEEAVLRVVRSGRYVLGEEVERFESEWAAYCGANYCVATGNALDSLRIILAAHGIGQGDEVLVPSNTYIATWLGVTHAGARPVPVEPHYASMNMNPQRVEDAITERTRAILAVHLYGTPADMVNLRAIAEQRNLLLIDDAAQAHGARVGAQRIGDGKLSDATAFSFYPTKNLGALGDAGCITTDSRQIADAARRLRNYGGVGRLDHTVLGINSRMDEMQAAILTAKLPHLNVMNAQRCQRAEVYAALLGSVVDEGDLSLPLHDPGAVWHQYVCKTNNRAAFIQYMHEAGVEIHVHYPVPPHRERAYWSGHPYTSQPVAEELGEQVFSLPIGYDVNQRHVADLMLQCGALR